MTRPITDVVAAVLLKANGNYLLAQRPVGKVYAGYWEFPGGKVEPGESRLDALKREIREELGVDVVTAHPWLTRFHVYEHASVRLNFFRVTKWTGELRGLDLQQFAFQTPGCETVGPMLPANGPLLKAMALPARYVISNASELGEAGAIAQLERHLQAGVRLIQVREKAIPEPFFRQFIERVVALARTYDARVLLNAADPAAFAVARERGFDGVHLTSATLKAMHARPDFPLVAASCHSADELAKASALDLDFAVLGPVQATRSHPGTTPMGWAGFAACKADATLPVFALGGMRTGDESTAWQHGAHGIAMMRG